MHDANYYNAVRASLRLTFFTYWRVWRLCPPEETVTFSGIQHTGGKMSLRTLPREAAHRGEIKS
ncbi:hypothetical protein E2C01_007947 [Portunus trituberculatus]|uniref:Uncharacterized protein n=1 Tax=Portunus trituberculatus TaxID=210409 RepID=A0A5B7D503_PORTR|nr:hypothetical protein [Portunus trituberculatus]